MAAHDLLHRLRALPAAALLAGEPGVWVVGGAVRDALLGREPHELDLVVEGDAIALAERLGGVVTAHLRFGTARVRRPEATFDLGSARRESYPRPGALPEVELGASIEEDLRRRDFTVNAMAVSLVDGELRAVPGAREDLAVRRLRVLHDASFRDDPTRLLRLARYATRLGFEPDPETAALADAAVAGGALETVTPERLGAELRLLLREPQPAALLRLERGGLGEALLGSAFRVDPELVARAAALCPSDARPDLVALGASLSAPAPDLAARLRDLGFEARDAAVLTALVSRDASPATPAEADALFGRRPLEAAVLAAARGDEGAARWLDTDRHRTLAITGHDLLAAGLSGPAVGAALRAARVAMLEDRAPDREAQLAAALASGTVVSANHPRRRLA